MQHTDQREQPAGGIEVDRNFVTEPLHQQRGTLVVQRTPAHVDRLDLREAGTPDCLVIALADHEVIPDDPAKRGERQDDYLARSVRHRTHLDAQPVLLDRQMEMIRPGASGGRLEMVLLQEIEDRDRPLMLDIGAAADDRVLVESYAGDPPGAARVAHLRRFNLRERGRAGSRATRHAHRGLPPGRDGSPEVRASQGSPRRSGLASYALEN